MAGHSAEFRLDVGHEVGASDFDREIVERAAEILSSASRWNRSDSRTCPEAAAVWSVYCALERATVEVSGGFHHRRPALEVVRQIVGERAVGRGYRHRLMDYNNDPSQVERDRSDLVVPKEALDMPGAELVGVPGSDPHAGKGKVAAVGGGDDRRSVDVVEYSPSVAVCVCPNRGNRSTSSRFSNGEVLPTLKSW